jgi:hypothetical protein
MSIVGEPPPEVPQPAANEPRWPSLATIRSASTRTAEFLLRLGTWLWRWIIGRFLFTSLALVLAVIILFFLPQTQHILWQLPSLSGLSGSELALSIAFYAYLAALIAIYGFLAYVVVPGPDGVGWSPRLLGTRRVRDDLVDPHVPAPPPRPGRFADFAEAPIRAALRFSWRTRRRSGWLAFLLGLLIYSATGYYTDSLPAWGRTLGRLSGLALGLGGLWLTLIPRGLGPGIAIREGEATPRLGFKLNMAGRALWILALTSLLGEFLWSVTSWFPDSISLRIYTIWAVIQLVFVLTTLARIVDALHVYSAWNVRALCALGVIVALVGIPSKQVGRFWRLPPRPTTAAVPIGDVPGAAPMPSGQGGPPPPLNPAGSPTLPMDETIETIWFNALEDRLNHLPPGPAIFVSASGGGARAAMFTALVLEAMRHTSSTGRPLGQEVTPPAPAAGTPQGPPLAPSSPGSLADRIVLISSVSGGSLAAAYYVHQTFPHIRAFRDRDASSGNSVEPVAPGPIRRARWRNAFSNEIYARMRSRSFRMLDEARIGRARNISSWTGRGFLETLELVAGECDGLVSAGTGRAGVSAASPAIAPWLSTSAFVDDMATDFMAPLLRGILSPGVERGESVTRYWEEQFGWHDVEDLDLHRRPDPNRPASAGSLWSNNAPVILFNTCDVTRGSRLILGFPPVPPGLITDPLASPTTHGPYSLTDRGDLYYHFGLAEAVRLSANFPWGFEVAHLPLRSGDETILALDGGIVDNSGIDSIAHLLQGLARQDSLYQSALNKGLYPEPRSLPARAHEIMGRLRERGILLVQVDSGTKEIRTSDPGIFSFLAAVAPAIFRPLQALNNTSYTNADLATLSHDLVLQSVLSPEAPTRGAPVVPEPPTDEPPRAPESLPDSPAATCTPQPVAPPAPDADSTPTAVQGPPVRFPAPPAKIPMPPVVGKGTPSVHGVATLAGPPLIWRVRLTCNQSANVITAWTLGPDDKAQVLVQFLIEWANQGPVVAQCLDRVNRTAMAYQTYNSPALQQIDEDWELFQFGQKLDDRGRAEFYQIVTAPASRATLPSTASLSTLIDDETRRRLRLYDQTFRAPITDSSLRSIVSIRPDGLQAPAASPATGPPPAPPSP